MKIIVLSPSGETYFNRRITGEAALKEIDCVCFNPSDLILADNNIFYRGVLLFEPDVCILRTPPFREDKDYFHLTARLLEAKGVPVINSPDAVEISGNKLRTKMKLISMGIPVLKSVTVRKKENLDYAVGLLGGYPVFMKTIYGTRGIGVIFCPCRETLHAAAQTMWAYYSNIFIEEYAEKSEGRTIRCLVCGDKVIGGVSNSPENSLSKHENFTRLFDSGSGYESNMPLKINDESPDKYRLIRSNFSRGGEIEKVHISEELSHMAVEACKAAGLKLAGVDLIETDEGWAVLEINSSPGIKGFESSSGVNAASEILDYISR